MDSIRSWYSIDILSTFDIDLDLSIFTRFVFFYLFAGSAKSHQCGLSKQPCVTWQERQNRWPEGWIPWVYRLADWSIWSWKDHYLLCPGRISGQSGHPCLLVSWLKTWRYSSLIILLGITLTKIEKCSLDQCDLILLSNIWSDYKAYHKCYNFHWGRIETTWYFWQNLVSEK